MADLFGAGNAYQSNYGAPQGFTAPVSSPGTFGSYTGIPSRPTISSVLQPISNYAYLPNQYSPYSPQTQNQGMEPVIQANMNMPVAQAPTASVTPSAATPSYGVLDATPKPAGIPLPTVGPAKPQDPNQPAGPAQWKVKKVGSAPVSNPGEIPAKWLPMFHGAGYGFTVKGGAGATKTPGGWFRGDIVSAGFTPGTPTTY